MWIIYDTKDRIKKYNFIPPTQWPPPILFLNCIRSLNCRFNRTPLISSPGDGSPLASNGDIFACREGVKLFDKFLFSAMEDIFGVFRTTGDTLYVRSFLSLPWDRVTGVPPSPARVPLIIPKSEMMAFIFCAEYFWPLPGDFLPIVLFRGLSRGECLSRPTDTSGLTGIGNATSE